MSEANNETGVAAVDADVSNIWDKVDGMVDGLLSLLPNLAIAAIFLVVMLGVAGLVRRGVERAAGEREDLGRVGGQLARWAIIIAASLLAITMVAPSIKPADLLAGLGVGSVAIGFAFKDILQNILAGILILLRQPFEVGDQIVSEGHEGTVERIETRATIIKTYDGRRVVIPNSEIYTHAVVVNTAHEQRRSQYDVGIGYADSMDDAIKEMMRAMKSVDSVLSEPAPEVIVWELAGSTVNLRARWWHDPSQSSLVHTRGEVIREIKLALDKAAIDMPYPTQVHLFHDQTEETDGDRTAQREGWPAGQNPPRAAGRRSRLDDRREVAPSDAQENSAESTLH